MFRNTERFQTRTVNDGALSPYGRRRAHWTARTSSLRTQCDVVRWMDGHNAPPPPSRTIRVGRRNGWLPSTVPPRPPAAIRRTRRVWVFFFLIDRYNIGNRSNHYRCLPPPPSSSSKGQRTTLTYTILFLNYYYYYTYYNTRACVCVCVCYCNCRPRALLETVRCYFIFLRVCVCVSL